MGPGSSDKLSMKKQMVYWKPIRSISKLGKPFLNHYYPILIDGSYKGRLLFEILSMDFKTPISFEDAANLALKERIRASDAGQIGYEPGQCFWYHRNFVNWISDQGYSIELTGDEFETSLMCGVVA
jgi:hypothetical protein